MFHHVTELNDVHHEAVVEEGAVIGNHFEGHSQRIRSRFEKRQGVAVLVSRLEMSIPHEKLWLAYHSYDIRMSRYTSEVG